jgi:protein TonB
LHTAKVEGDVLVQFVVDTLGRVDSTTFHVLKSTHDLFTLAVKDVVFRYRFRPAELGGRSVKQLVQMPFDFRTPP